MSKFLTAEERDVLRLSFTTAGFSMEDAIEKLKGKGLSDEEARLLIIAEYKAFKQELFDRTLKRENSHEMAKVMFVVVVLISVIGPVFGIESLLWYLVAGSLCGIAGYIAYKDKPVAGVVAGFIFAVVFPFAYNGYFANRTSYIKIEMLIPLIMAAIPAGVAFLILAKLFYSDTDHEY